MVAEAGRYRRSRGCRSRAPGGAPGAVAGIGSALGRAFSRAAISSAGNAPD